MLIFKKKLTDEFGIRKPFDEQISIEDDRCANITLCNWLFWQPSATTKKKLFVFYSLSLSLSPYSKDDQVNKGSMVRRCSVLNVRMLSRKTSMQMPKRSQIIFFW